jgi:hypothetical protein
VPKHASGKFSQATLFWETSMPLGKKFFANRSELPRVERSATADAESAPASRVHVLRLPTNTREAVPSDAIPRRFVLTTGFELISKAATRCSIFAELAFTNLPVAALSWVMTQFFAGCAAYAEAMYPSAGYVSSNDTLHRCGSTESDRPEGNRVGLSPQLAPDLKELSGYAIDAEARQSAVPSIQAGSVSIQSGGNGNIVWLNVTQKTPSRRLVSTAVLVTSWLSRRRRSAPGRAIAVELRNCDRRTPRGAAMPRYSIE